MVTFVNLSAHTSYKQIFVVVQESRVMVKQLLFRTTLCYINHTRHVGFVQWAILNLLPNATVEPSTVDLFCVASTHSFPTQ